MYPQLGIQLCRVGIHEHLASGSSLVKSDQTLMGLYKTVAITSIHVYVLPICPTGRGGGGAARVWGYKIPIGLFIDQL